MKLSPVNQKRWKRFHQNKRAFICLIIFSILTIISMGSEIVFNDKALMVKYKGDYYFPIVQDQIPAKTFGLEGDSEANYLTLQNQFNNSDNFVVMPLVPFSADTIDKIDTQELDKKINLIDQSYNKKANQIKTEKSDSATIKTLLFELNIEKNLKKGALEELKYHPLPPNLEQQHYLGTDSNGRDIFSRLSYGYRIAIGFALILLVINYSIGVSIGCLMGYVGGWFDLIVQRIIEVLSNVPFLYVIIIIAAIIREKGGTMGFWSLVGIYAFFGWMGMTWYMRTTTFKEKSREYILAARANGASNSRIIFSHILPNVMSLLVTFIPFSISGSIVGLTSLDYLGYGLPKGTPSWGELIKLGIELIHAPWIITSVVCIMSIVLFLINSVGEGVRDAFDPKQVSTYE
jgi:microcin C transport system permease protein